MNIKVTAQAFAPGQWTLQANSKVLASEGYIGSTLWRPWAHEGITLTHVCDHILETCTETGHMPMKYKQLPADVRIPAHVSMCGPGQGCGHCHRVA